MLHNSFSPLNYQCIENDDIHNEVGEADDGDNECNVSYYRDKGVNHQEVSELLNSIRVKNINNIIVAYWNINTFKNKYDCLTS